MPIKLPPHIVAVLERARAGELSLPEAIAALEDVTRDARTASDLALQAALARIAWHELSVETEKVAASFTPPPPLPDPDIWTELAEDPFIRGLDDAAQYHERLRAHEGRFLQPAVRRSGGRHVTLMELVSALEQAVDEVDARAARAEQAAERRREIQARREAAHLVAHEDDDAAVLARVRERLGAVGAGPVELRALAGGHSRLALVEVLAAALELRKRGEVELDQEDFPFGRIFIRPVASK